MGICLLLFRSLTPVMDFAPSPTWFSYYISSERRFVNTHQDVGMCMPDRLLKSMVIGLGTMAVALGRFRTVRKSRLIIFD